MTPKPAYNELKKLIKGKWWTQTETTTEAAGKAEFRGFYGQYEVTSKIGGRKITGTFTLDKSKKTAIEVRLS
jgi:hypothetical protein